MCYQRVLCHAANLYHQMLSSWVGERAEPIAALWQESVPRIMLPAKRRITAVQNTNS
jgi:hypothetical protein